MCGRGAQGENAEVSPTDRSSSPLAFPHWDDESSLLPFASSLVLSSPCRHLRSSHFGSMETAFVPRGSDPGALDLTDVDALSFIFLPFRGCSTPDAKREPKTKTNRPI